MRLPGYHRWTRYEQQFIEMNYQAMTDQQMAAYLNLTTLQVTGCRLSVLGLRKRSYYRKVA